MADLTVIILTKNEEVNIRRCIESVEGLAKQIVVVDSFSTDNTVEIAKSMGVEVYQNPWTHYAGQFNWALDNIEIKSKWVFRHDADEVVTPELREEIETMCKQHAEDDVNGFCLRYKVFFLGKFLKHGGAYTFEKITIFKKGLGRFENRAMGDHVVLSEGRSITLKNDGLHYDFKDLTRFVDKHNAYATREVIDHMNIVNGDIELSKLNNKEAQSAKKLRDGLYYKLPLFWRAKLYYWYCYYLRMGFLDGTPGRVYAFIQAYFYRYLIDAKMYEKSLEEKVPLIRDINSKAHRGGVIGCKSIFYAKSLFYYTHRFEKLAA